MSKYLIIFVIFLTACTGSLENDNNSIFTIDRFPNNIGNNWNYYLFNENGEKTGNLSCKIISDTTINNIPSRVWEYISAHDSLLGTTVTGLLSHRYLITDGNSISINYIRNSQYYIKSIFKLPFNIGKEWQYSFTINGDIIDQDYRVLNIESISLDNKIYYPSFRVLQQITLKDSINDPNPFLTEYTERWFVPDIGIVKIHSSLILRIGTTQGSWLDTISITHELNSYSIM